MRITIVIICLFATGMAKAQDGLIWRTNAKGITKKVQFSSWENGRINYSYVRTHHVREMRMKQYSIKKGKLSRLPVSERLDVFTPDGNLERQTQWYKGKPRYDNRMQSKPVANGYEFLREHRGKKNKFIYASRDLYDSIAQTHVFTQKRKEQEDLRLVAISKLNEAGRIQEHNYYSRKGELKARTIYSYHSPTKLKKISFYNGNGQLKREQHYTCDPPLSDSLKGVKTTSLCIRTDKDPMGNTIEIEEQRSGHKHFTVMRKYTPDHRLLEVQTMNAKGKVIAAVHNTYNENNQLVNTSSFWKNSRIPSVEKRYTYDGEIPKTCELWEQGKKITEYVYEFKPAL